MMQNYVFSIMLIGNINKVYDCIKSLILNRQIITDWPQIGTYVKWTNKIRLAKKSHRSDERMHESLKKTISMS